MKKQRWLAALLCATMCLSMNACQKEDSSGKSNSSKEEPSDSKTPPDLTGEWKQSNSNSDEAYQGLYISEDTIEVYWVVDDEEDGETVMLYWAGSFTPPADAKEPYQWESSNDTDRTDSALMASGDDTKTFTYENGTLSYSVSAMGETATVEAKKQNWGYDPAEFADQKMEGAGNLDDFYVEIKGASLAEDYQGNSAIIITYAWTNNSDDTTSAMSALMEQAFQNGVELESAIIMDSSVYDSENSMKDIRPGATLEIQKAYLLDNTASSVEFEVSEFLGFSNSVVSVVFEMDALS